MSQFLSILESLTLPGQPASTCKNCKLLAQIPCSTSQWNFFRLTYIWPCLLGATMCMWVQSIAPNTFGDCDPILKSSIILALHYYLQASTQCIKYFKTMLNNLSLHRRMDESVTQNLSFMLCFVSWCAINQMVINRCFSGVIAVLPLLMLDVRWTAIFWRMTSNVLLEILKNLWKSSRR